MASSQAVGVGGMDGEGADIASRGAAAEHSDHRPRAAAMRAKVNASPITTRPGSGQGKGVGGNMALYLLFADRVNTAQRVADEPQPPKALSALSAG